MNSFESFVINLEKDRSRLGFMDKQLANLGIPYTRISGVLGSLLTEEDLQNVYDAQYINTHRLGQMSLGEIGCAASHKNAYTEFLASGAGYALVLEDDVQLPEDFKAILEKQIAGQDTSGWEYLSFDYYAYGFPFLRLWIPGVISILKSKDGLISKIIFSATIIVKLPFVLCASLYEEIQKLVCKDAPITPIRPIYFAGCYLITRAGAQKLLSVHDKILYIADRLPNVARKQNNLNFKIYTPLVVTQLKETFASNLSSIK